MRVGAFALTFAAAVACTRSAAAHEKPSYPVDGADENLTVTLPLVDTSPIIDGALGEGEWENAVRLSSFRRCWTFRGAPAMVQTTVYLMGGDGRLYVAFECEIDDPSKLQASETREDAQLWTEDHVSILLDTLHDHRRVIELAASPGGARYDARWGNNEWDAVWEVAARVYEECYIVEIDLDLSSLTYEQRERQTFGINFVRYSMDPYEVTAWMVDGRLGSVDSRCFPHLAGIVLPEKLAERPMKVDVYTVAMNESKSGAEGSSIEAGLDVEYPLTPSVTSRFTLFPDFEINAAGVKDNDFGLGDIDFSPLSIAWHRDRYDLAVGLDFFAPTGQYNKLNPASPGKDFWTTMFTGGATYYFNEEKTWSAAILARYETHSNKGHSDIKPGDNFHFEWGIGKAIDETLEVGLAGYSQWQVTDDSGSDVTWSKSIHDQVHAIGPEVNLAIPSKSMFLTFRYLWEFHAVDSPEGQLMALTLTKRF